MNCIRKQGMKTMLTGLPVTIGLISNIVINNKPINYWKTKMNTKSIRKVVYHIIYLIDTKKVELCFIEQGEQPHIKDNEIILPHLII